METRLISAEMLEEFEVYLKDEEKSPATVEKYLRDVSQFCLWLGKSSGSFPEVTKAAVSGWKEALISEGRSPGTVNGKLSALDKFFAFAGWEDCRVRHLKIQRRMFIDDSRELTRDEYERLLAAAEKAGKEWLALLIETICATGIRVSEVKHITVDAVRYGRAEIRLKGKIRVILIPQRLRKKLLKYVRKRGIPFGEIFLTKGGKPLDRRRIWAEMKSLCRLARVCSTKVFPHNLRHLFARTFYAVTGDMAGLADVLGHSSLDTTRIYLVSTAAVYMGVLNRLGLVS